MRTPTLPLPIPFAIATIVAAGCLQAQTANRLGFSAGLAAGTASRIGANALVGDALQHFDDRDYRDWMLDPTNIVGTTFVFTGLTFTVQDQVAATPDTFTVVGYGPDPAAPDFPDPAGPWFRTGPVALPPGTVSTPAAWHLTLTLTPPARPSGDVWLGCGLPQPATGSWPTDGLSLQAALTPRANLGRGFLGLPVANLSCFVQTAGGLPVGAAIYPNGPILQLELDVFANVTGGVSCTRIGTPPGTPLVPLGGTTDMIAGSNPDTFNFSASTPLRADSPGFLVTDTNFASAPLFLLLGFAPNPLAPVPALAFPLALPGTRGNICLDLASANLTIAFTDASGRFQHTVPMTPALSAQIAALQPFDVWWQAFVVNLSVSTTLPVEMHGTGCAIQHL